MTEQPVIDCGACVLRPWRAGDLDSLVRHANDERISRNLRDRFPYPYTRADGQAFLAHLAQPSREWRYAIDVEGEAVGGFGYRPGEDVHRFDAELGYWLGCVYWRRGIVSAAIRASVPIAMQAMPLLRVHASAYSANPASMRLLEHCGFEREGVLRAAVVKRGAVFDLMMYSVVRRSLDAPIPDLGGPRPPLAR